MSVLLLRDEGTGQARQVWPAPGPDLPGFIQERRSYLFELDGPADAADADLLIDDTKLEALRPGASCVARWRWSPGYYAGLVEAELRLTAGRTCRFGIGTDPDLRKMSRDQFDTMVREILEDTFALFSLTSFRKGIAHGTGDRPPAIARLEFLRSRIGSLEAAVARIVRNPRRRLSSAEIVLPLHRARHATGIEILRSFRSGRIGRETAEPSRLPPGLRAFLPEHVRTQQKTSSLDIPEHRQIVACLRAWSGWLGAAADTLDRSASDRNLETGRGAALWAVRCRHLAGRLTSLAGAEPFAEAGEAAPRLILTALFRRDPAYREIYRIWQDINLGIAAVFGDFLNLPLARTFELYELWCFLRLLRAAADTFGLSALDVHDLFMTDAAGGLTLMTGAATVPVGSGWYLSFQKQYREFWLERDGSGSYSRTMTPDIVLLHEDTTGRMDHLIVLDAKYRIGSALDDALSSIHMYRDALVSDSPYGTNPVVSAAYLLTPDKPSLGTQYRDTPMPARLFHPEYRASFKFGAVTLQPGMNVEMISAALKRIISDSTTRGSPP